jgi:hypothetical protein
MDSTHVIRHEFVHALLRYHPVRYPLWYEEGLSELLSTALFEGASVIIGIPPKERLHDYMELIPFSEIMAEDYNPHLRTIKYGDPYLQYWFLVSYLLLGSEQRLAQLNDCLTLIHLGMTSLEAFEVAFRMTPKQLWDSELKSYANNLKSRGKVVSHAIPPGQMDLDFQARPVPREEADKFLQIFKPAT